MQCPLLVQGNITAGVRFGKKTTDCLQEECAWWQKDTGECSVKLTAIFAGCLTDEITALTDTIAKRR